MRKCRDTVPKLWLPTKEPRMARIRNRVIWVSLRACLASSSTGSGVPFVLSKVPLSLPQYHLESSIHVVLEDVPINTRIRQAYRNPSMGGKDALLFDVVFCCCCCLVLQWNRNLKQVPDFASQVWNIWKEEICTSFEKEGWKCCCFIVRWKRCSQKQPH